MPEMPDVVSSEPVEASWGNDIRDRTVQRYADATARDISVPFPAAGDLAWLDDTGAATVFTGTAWRDIVLNNDLWDIFVNEVHVNGNPGSAIWDASVRRIGLATTFSVWSAANSFLRLRVGADDTTSYLMRLYDRAGAEDVIYAFTEDGLVAPAETWVAMPLGNGWGNFGDEFQVARYRHGTGRNSVEVQGLIKDGTIGSGTVIATLPAGFRPAATIRAVTTSNDVPVNFDVNAAGNIKIAGAGWSASWASLEFSFAIN